MALALGYARPRDREALAALFALDARLGGIVRGTREPMVGQMRLTWWHEALIGLERGSAPAEPVLRALAATVIGRGVPGVDLAAMIDGWELLLDGPALADAVLVEFAERRGGRLFELAARLLGTDEAVAGSGEGWALADLACHWSDDATARRAGVLAGERLGRRRWNRAGRPLGALALLAAADVQGRSAPGAPARVGRLLLHRLTGW
jgi:phytoene synthase